MALFADCATWERRLQPAGAMGFDMNICPTSPSDSAAYTCRMPFGDHSRGYLPHVDRPRMCQSVTFRLADAVPGQTIARWQGELSGTPDGERTAELRRRIDRFEDAGHGACLFLQPGLADIVAAALTSGDGAAYRLYAWVVMPNHVHALIGPLPDVDRVDLSSLTQRWKGRTARLINQARGASGTVWQRESWDRWIRDIEHFERVAMYIETNPLRAGLNGWRWVSGHTIAPAG